MDSLSFYIKYTILGIIAILAYALNLSDLMNAITLFVFGGCIFFVCILVGHDLARRKMTFYTEKFVTQRDRSDATELIENEVPEPDGSGRYASQELFSRIKAHGQSYLMEKHVCIVGIGSLGAAAAELLTRAGIGKLSLIDNDCVTLPDLQDHALFRESDIGKSKATGAEDRLRMINSSIDVRGHRVRIHEANKILMQSDLVLDCTNSLKFKEQINHYCNKNRISWIFCLTTMKKGYIKIMRKKSANFTAIMKQLQVKPSKNTFNPTTHMCAAIITTQAIKFLLNKQFEKDMISFNIWDQTIRIA